MSEPAVPGFLLHDAGTSIFNKSIFSKGRGWGGDVPMENTRARLRTHGLRGTMWKQSLEAESKEEKPALD